MPEPLIEADNVADRLPAAAVAAALLYKPLDRVTKTTLVLQVRLFSCSWNSTSVIIISVVGLCVALRWSSDLPRAPPVFTL